MAKLTTKKPAVDQDGRVYDSFEVALSFVMRSVAGRPNGVSQLALKLTPYKEENGEIIFLPEATRRVLIGDVEDGRQSNGRKALVSSLEKAIQAIINDEEK